METRMCFVSFLFSFNRPFRGKVFPLVFLLEILVPIVIGRLAILAGALAVVLVIAQILPLITRHFSLAIAPVAVRVGDELVDAVFAALELGLGFF